MQDSASPTCDGSRATLYTASGTSRHRLVFTSPAATAPSATTAPPT
jgi:hypothetical protein